MAFICSLIYHSINEEGFLVNENAVASVQLAHAGAFFPKVNLKRVKQLMEEDAVFIDARRKRDFKAGHLKDAINLQVDTDEAQRIEIMKKTSKSAKLIIYCQSNGCLYAEEVAVQLKDDGFTDISIFKGGWEKWKKRDGD